MKRILDTPDALIIEREDYYGCESDARTEEMEMTTGKQCSQFRDALFSGDLLDEAIDWISKNLNPDDVFPEHALRIWARDNGFTDDR